jgi:hypothetical protein
MFLAGAASHQFMRGDVAALGTGCKKLADEIGLSRPPVCVGFSVQREPKEFRENQRLSVATAPGSPVMQEVRAGHRRFQPSSESPMEWRFLQGPARVNAGDEPNPRD